MVLGVLSVLGVLGVLDSCWRIVEMVAGVYGYGFRGCGGREHGQVPWLRYARSLRCRETSGLASL